MELKDVPFWMIGDGPGHICVESNMGWGLSACGIWSPNYEVTPGRPRWVCKTCRSLLPKLHEKPKACGETADLGG